MNITYKNEKSIKKILKQPFVWAVLTVSNENGFHKIAIKKNLFKKTYTIKSFVDGKSHTEKKEISIEDLANKNINIQGLGKMHIEDISISLVNPSKKIEKEEKIYSKIEQKTKEAHQKQIEKQDNKTEEKKETIKIEKNYEIKSELKKMRSDLITAQKVISCWHTHGYNANEEDGIYTESYGIDFVINELEKISKKIGYKGFDNNRLHITLDKLKEYESKCDIYRSNINILHTYNGMLSQELTIRTIDLCNYIRQNNIEINNIEYNKYESWGNPFDCYQMTSESIKIPNEFDKLIEAVSIYVKNVTGEDIRESLQTSLNKQYLMVIK